MPIVSPISNEIINTGNNDGSQIIIEQGVGEYILIHLKDIKENSYSLRANLVLSRTASSYRKGYSTKNGRIYKVKKYKCWLGCSK